ncbi:MAG: N-formylglutamate amidohydrolase, partial [Gemmatimonadota bacterium]
MIVVSAEHGGNRVPPKYAALFQGQEGLLETHRGWDPGTAHLATRLARGLGVEAIVADVTRLLVDLNRSAHHPRVFSELSRRLRPVERRAILERHHRPHRDRVSCAVTTELDGGATVLHLG